MKITDKRDKKNFLTLNNLDKGDVFNFLNTDEVYMLLDGNYYVDLAEGTRYKIEDNEYNHQVEWLEVELIIHKQLL